MEKKRLEAMINIAKKTDTGLMITSDGKGIVKNGFYTTFNFIGVPGTYKMDLKSLTKLFIRPIYKASILTR